MSDKHIAEATQDVIDASRRVKAALENVKDDDLAAHLGLAYESEVNRARENLMDSCRAIDRLRVIATRAPQKAKP